MMAITRRYLLRFLRTPQLIFFATVQPVLFVLALDAVFGGLVQPGDPDAYIQFLIPGVLVMIATLFAGTTAFGIAEDLQAGIIDRFRSLPIGRSAVLVGRTVADLVRHAVSIVVVIAVGLAMGFRFRGGPASAVAAIALLLLFCFAASWMFASLGLAVKDPQAAQFAGFAPVLPLVYLSGAWIPVDAMDGTIQAFARNQPVNVLVEAVRALCNGAPALHWAWQSAAWSVGILAVFVVVSARQYGRT